MTSARVRIGGRLDGVGLVALIRTHPLLTELGQAKVDPGKATAARSRVASGIPAGGGPGFELAAAW